MNRLSRLVALLLLTCVATRVSAAPNPAGLAPVHAAKVAFLIFDGVQVIDCTGPFEMFSAAQCEAYTVAESKRPVTMNGGLTLTPDYSFADAPAPDVLVIPGGSAKAASENAPTLEFIKNATAHTQYTMSVCNGAFILANTGLLDGLTATTTNSNIAGMQRLYPKIKVVRDRRYVDNGRIITTGGLSAGIDGALHVIAKLYGAGYAQFIALREEYDWKPEGGFVRASLADQEIPSISLAGLGQWGIVRTEGDRSRWDLVMSGTSDLTPADLMKRFDDALSKGNWTSAPSSAAGSGARSSSWRFTGSDGKPWKGTVKLEAAAGGGHEYTATVAVARAG